MIAACTGVVRLLQRIVSFLLPLGAKWQRSEALFSSHLAVRSHDGSDGDENCLSDVRANTRLATRLISIVYKPIAAVLAASELLGRPM